MVLVPPAASAADNVDASSVTLATCPSIPTTHDPDVIKTVYRVGLDRQVSGKVMLAGFEAGWVESHMNNLNCGEDDSLGVFQQRPSKGWCDPASLCMDVEHASHQFFAKAQAEEAKCPSCSAGTIAQNTQISAYGWRYDDAEAKARDLMAEAKLLQGPPVDPVTAVGSAGLSFNGMFHVMAQGGSNTLLHHVYDPGKGWSAVRDAGGSVASKPSVVPYKGKMMIFARDGDNAVTYRSMTSSGWDDGWRRIIGEISGAPSTALVNNTLFVVARAGTAVRYRFLNDAGWNSDDAWRTLGSPSSATIVGDPVTAVHDNRMFVMARGSDNQIWVRIFNPATNPSWTGWFVLPGQITGTPTAASRGDTLLVFARAADGQVIYHTYTTGAASWGTNRPLFGAVVGNLAAVHTAEDAVFVYGRTATGELVYRFITEDGWNDHDTDPTRWRPLDKPTDTTLDGTPLALAYGSGQFIGSRATDTSLRARSLGANGWGTWVTIPGGNHAPIN